MNNTSMRLNPSVQINVPDLVNIWYILQIKMKIQNDKMNQVPDMLLDWDKLRNAIIIARPIHSFI